MFSRCVEAKEEKVEWRKGIGGWRKEREKKEEISFVFFLSRKSVKVGHDCQDVLRQSTLSGGSTAKGHRTQMEGLVA